jgi:hypothetical protein
VAPRRLAGGQAREQRVEVGARERPLERAGEGSVVLAEGQQPLGEFGERAEVVGSQRLALDDREEQLDLIEPGGVDGQVDQAGVGPSRLHPLDRGSAGVRAAIVDDPEHTPRRRVGLFGHHLLDQPPERLDAGLGLDAIEQTRVMDVPGCQVGQRAAAAVLELDQRRTARRGRHRRVAAPERLQLGLLVRADDKVARMQQLALKAARIEVEHAAGLELEVRVARKDPRALLPRLQRSIVQPAPDRRRRRLGDALLDHQPMQLSAREAAQRPVVLGRQFARDCHDLGDLLRGENGAGDPRAACPSTPRCPPHKSVFATC